ncbi:hypothetical protein CKM354_000618100 [Cercospora kikuchii]|uniref:Uncharacterized protein n=1 Tax=Cercospora kikuchii TaxID=84275 RepID=A0A9P3CHE7_9PEZI|nr:uncharacterized protein CKM354_000618100 [Cercospora kikuchii]GIZ42934.1 hypothetical protein CKM354_000618100 [Cercospora kikuchii]
MDERSKHDDIVLLVQVPSGSQGTRSIRTDFATAQETLIRWKFEYGSVSEDEENLEDMGYDDVLRDFHQDGLQRLRATPVRGSGVPINTAQAHPQTVSALFRLPSELRLHIYGLVFGCGVIHIRTRDCKRHCRPRPHFGFYRTYSYAVCQLLDTWASEYEESCKQGESPDPATPKKTYGSTHKRCTQHLPDFTTHEYTELPLSCRLIPRDAHRRRVGHRPDCDICEKHRIDLAETYGQPPEGLKRRHADSELDLNVLLTCRQVYHEAAKIPFENFVFDFNPSEVEHWASKILYTHQASAIKSVHFDCYVRPPHLQDLRGLDSISSVLKGVTQLRISISNPGFHIEGAVGSDASSAPAENPDSNGDHFEEGSLGWRSFTPQTKVQVCQVIIGQGGTRSERRGMAAQVERLFTESEIDASDQMS